MGAMIWKFALSPFSSGNRAMSRRDCREKSFPIILGYALENKIIRSTLSKVFETAEEKASEIVAENHQNAARTETAESAFGVCPLSGRFAVSLTREPEKEKPSKGRLPATDLQVFRRPACEWSRPSDFCAVSHTIRISESLPLLFVSFPSFFELSTAASLLIFFSFVVIDERLTLSLRCTSLYFPAVTASARLHLRPGPGQSTAV